MRRGPLLLAVAVFVLVRAQSGSWWWAGLAGIVANPILPIAIGLILGARGRGVDDEPKVFIPLPEIADDERSAQCVADVRGARDALIQIGSARIEMVRDIEVDEPDFGRGPFARGLNKFVDLMRHQVGEGVIDLRERRMMIDYGAYAEAQIGADHYGAYSGGPLRSVADMPGRAKEMEEQPTPLCFVAVLGHVARAAENGVDDVGGVRCRRLDVLLDLTASGPSGSATLWIPEWPDPARVPMVVWLEDSLLRRLRYQETAGTTYTLTLREVGLDLSALDWTRMGTFRTPPDQFRAEPNEI